MDITPCGFPHSDIRGSKRICRSPRLIAACHVLLRLPVPRHSPCALLRLTYEQLYEQHSFIGVTPHDGLLTCSALPPCTTKLFYPKVFVTLRSSHGRSIFIFRLLLRKMPSDSKSPCSMAQRFSFSDNKTSVTPRSFRGRSLFVLRLLRRSPLRGACAAKRLWTPKLPAQWLGASLSFCCLFVFIIFIRFSRCDETDNSEQITDNNDPSLPPCSAVIKRRNQ